MDLHDNQLDGEIPPELGSLSYLERLSLQENRLSGEIPSELGDLEFLQALYLGGSNRLTGCIPNALQELEESDFDDLGLSFCEAPEPDSVQVLRGRCGEHGLESSDHRAKKL